MDINYEWLAAMFGHAKSEDYQGEGFAVVCTCGWESDRTTFPTNGQGILLNPFHDQWASHVIHAIATERAVTIR